MMFMEDSERAATLARERCVDAGLHLNFTLPFSGRKCPSELVRRQQRLVDHLRGHRLSQLMFHPGLRGDFEYVTAAQIDEFRRLYGSSPYRIDGHHHMHLCMNVLAQRLLPEGVLVRRTFSFRAGEKSALNRAYRTFLDRTVVKRHQVVDGLFTLAPLDAERLRRIYALARHAVIELETHPVQTDEYRYLIDGEFFRAVGDTPLGSHAEVSRRDRTRTGDV
jgi:predicted glycoside hydrolase/deacetylase ChbG (UPF0249 family)